MDKDLEIDILKWLAGEEKLFKKQKIVHNYPHCWRCKTPLYIMRSQAGILK